ncbi:hypothetical protein GWC95_15410 [Sediminibacterium roseum]|uniref:NigD-like protein n=1 Tax=Sediminibacterium roseum TaxID=1978412 RepID=A0ABW9ZXT1_9BACT|nr:hypothetical protein [Sediminibacterium roseum]NCI51315.1 hypothetical protein [Sediminibacterium roseum]
MKLALVLIAAVVMYGCSDKYKTIYSSALIPVLAFNHDTLHIREKDSLNITGWPNPILWVKSIPSLPVMHMMFSEPTGKVHFMYRQEPMRDSEPIIVAGDSTSLYCHCDMAGVYPVDFYLLDQLERVSTKQLIVNCLANDKARASLSVSFVDSSRTDNWAYRLDASATSKKYGRIYGYYFNVNGLPFYSFDAFVDYVFHARGEQKISVFVKDDLGLHSDTVTAKIVIP